MKNINVVLVEDDADLAEEIEFYLQLKGMNVTSLQNGKLLDNWLAQNRCDVLLLDLTLPGEDGLSIAQRLSTRHDFRIIMFTSRIMSDERVAGFEAGADVYLNKPVNFAELVAVITRLTKRLYLDSTITTQPFWQLVLPLFSLISPSGKQIKLTTNESHFLTFLAETPNNYLTREGLEQKLWKMSNSHTARRLEVLVSRLRQKLQKENEELIQTHWREGYSIIKFVQIKTKAN